MLSPPDVVRLMHLGWEITQSRRARDRFYLTPAGLLDRINAAVALRVELLCEWEQRPALRFDRKPAPMYKLPSPKVRCTPLNFTKIDVLAYKLARRIKEIV